MKATVRGAGKHGVDLLGSQDEILRASAISTAEAGTRLVGTPATLPAPSSSAGNVQVGQVAAADHLDGRWTVPTVVDGQIVTHPPYRSPLDADEHGQYPTVLRGGVVHDADEIEKIRARVDRGRRRVVVLGRGTYEKRRQDEGRCGRCGCWSSGPLCPGCDRRSLR